jgi:hypothetical protein
MSQSFCTPNNSRDELSPRADPICVVLVEVEDLKAIRRFHQCVEANDCTDSAPFDAFFLSKRLSGHIVQFSRQRRCNNVCTHLSGIAAIRDEPVDD